MSTESTKIALTISQTAAPDDSLHLVVRVFCQVAFRTATGYTTMRWAIVDTGAPTSLIPFHIWSQCRVLKLGDRVVEGIVTRPECGLGVIEGVISCVLGDGVNVSNDMVIRAYLAPDNNVPLLLGFGGLLDRVTMHLSVANRAGYLRV